MTLILEIEHLLGVAFAAQNQASSTPDWPPQPDRVFSALVAAWGARGERPDERRALEWLEAQPVPDLAASEGHARSAATVFVPPNDPQTGRVGNRSVMPALRRRQPRRFPAFRPHDPIVRLIWRDADADDQIVMALNALAADTAYVGHSSSLTRCRFRTDGLPPEHTRPARRRVYGGRIAELERNYRAGRRPSPGQDLLPVEPADEMPPTSSFSARWLVLAHVGGEMPDLLGSAIVARALRNALMSGYKNTVGEDRIPALVSGHAADGTPLAEPHLAIAPLAFLGTRHADGRVLGFALIPPRAGGLLDDIEFQNALRNIALWNQEESRREVRVRGEGFDLMFAPSGEDTRRTLDPAPYVAVATTWATCTPIVLDRHLRTTKNAQRDEEVRNQIAQACRNAGLPAPARVGRTDEQREGYAIAAGKHSAVRGASPAFRSRNAPRWTNWRLPKSLASRQLTHAVLQFDKPVRGPVILGAGRFVGLGLCRALEAQEA